VCQASNIQRRLGLLPPVDWNGFLPRLEIISVTGNQKMSSACVNISYFCTMLRRKMVKEIKLLDEGKHPLLGSDNEYNARARNAG
jgi:GT2 family glycosyltransferase